MLCPPIEDSASKVTVCAGRLLESVPAIAPKSPDPQRLVMAAPGLVPATIFSFPLDDFKLDAIGALNQGHSVVVSVPTGFGKTFVEEYSINLALALCQKV